MREPPILNKVAVAHPDTSFFLKKGSFASVFL